MRFSGEYLDDTGLYHLRARQYDPTTGRFRSTDPLAPAIEDPYVSAYVYVGNQPTVFVGPSGLFRIPGTNITVAEGGCAVGRSSGGCVGGH
jgi:RHS repeat-associated protein